MTDLSKFNQPFAKPLAIVTAGYAYQVLLYMQRRPELEMEGIGTIMSPYLLNVRHVQDEHYRTYYEALSGVIRALLKYASLEESCYKSGAYNTDRLKTLDSVRLAIAKFESPEDPRQLDYLSAMLDTTVGA